MKKAYLYFAAVLLTASSLSSCSRANYAFTNPATPAYLGSAGSPAAVRPVAAAPQTAAEVIAAAPAVAVAPIEAEALAAAPVATTMPARQQAAEPESAKALAAVSAVAPTPAKAAKPTLAQRLVLNKMLKQAAKAQARQQNTAGVTHTAAKTPGVTLGLVGLVALLIGILVSSGFLIVAGIIVLLVGIILYLLSA